MSAASPLIAGGLYQTIGPSAAFYYVASLFGLAAIVLLFLPIKMPSHEEAEAHHHD